MTMTEHDIFEQAANLLMTGGHCKMRLHDENGAHCAVGAINKVAFGTPDPTPHHPNTDVVVAAFRRAEAKLANEYLVSWNNAPERTGEDVILLFKELAHETQVTT